MIKCKDNRSRTIAETCHEASTSFKTFTGTHNAIEDTKPLWFVLENVDLGEEGSDDSNLSIIMTSLRGLNYTVRLPLANSALIPEI
jgi:site-specific DNA-cytosine methylase